MLRATRYRIPGFICPFNFSGFHFELLKNYSQRLNFITSIQKHKYNLNHLLMKLNQSVL